LFLILHSHNVVVQELLDMMMGVQWINVAGLDMMMGVQWINVAGL